MLNAKRKIIVSACAAVILLSGCASKENPASSVGSSSSATEVNSTASSVSSKSSSRTSTAISSASGSTSTSTDSSESVSTAESSAPVSTTSETSETPAPNVSDENTIVYTHDPKNYCSVTFDGLTVTVRFKKDSNAVVNLAEEYPTFTVNKYEDGDFKVYELTSDFSTFATTSGLFYIVDANGYWTNFHLDLSNGEIKFPDISAVVENNRNVVNSATDASVGKVLSYITRDGKRDNARKVLNEIKELSDKICAGIDDDYEKLRAIANWTSANIYYDHPAYNEGIPQECLSLEYMLDNKSSVCGGYSNMTSALCAAQGICVLNIAGNGLLYGNTFLSNMQGEFHEWDVAEIDGRQIIVDAGWDSHNSYQTDMQFYSDAISYDYFDIGEEMFALEHKAKSAEYRDYWAVLED